MAMELLIGLLQDWLAERDDAFVGGDMFFYFSATQARRNDFRGPDVFVVLGTERKDRKSWVVWEEDGKVPDVVFEITSETSEAMDKGRKKQAYAGLKVREYFIYDPYTGAVEGWRLSAKDGQYRPLRPTRAGRLASQCLGVEVGVWNGSYRQIEAPWLRCFLPGGMLLPTPEERAAEAEQRATAAEQRVGDLEAQLRAYKERLGTVGGQ
jgi:Uma2 family endonuclease